MLKRLPRSIWVLGFVSMFMDISSEMIHSLLPLFMITTLGASVTLVGIVDGITEATTQVVKIFSGAISDYFRKRKLLVLLGYGIAAFSKPLFPLAHNIPTVLAARFLDRIGKGIRGAPRDALIGDITPPDLRGAAFGLRQTLDTIGAVLGPLLAMTFMLLLAGDMRRVMWIATIPAALCVTLLALGIKEPQTSKIKTARSKFHIRDIRTIGAPFWRLVTIAALLTFARFSEAFLLLKGQEVGLPLALVPLVIVAMNIIYALGAYPAGTLSDRMNRRTVVLIGAVILIAADLVLGFAEGYAMLMLGASLWGLHMALTQSPMAAMVSDTAPAHLRGTAYGVYNLVSGLAMLLAGIVAGLLWDGFGPATTFFTGAAFTALAITGIVFFLKDKT